MRFLNNKNIKDFINTKTGLTKTLLDNLNGLSVNQLNAQFKLAECWKAVNVANYLNKITEPQFEVDFCENTASMMLLK